MGAEAGPGPAASTAAFVVATVVAATAVAVVVTVIVIVVGGDVAVVVEVGAATAIACGVTGWMKKEQTAFPVGHAPWPCSSPLAANNNGYFVRLAPSLQKNKKQRKRIRINRIRTHFPT